MPGEELIQRNYIVNGKLKGIPFGEYEVLELGSTTINELINVGLIQSVPSTIDFPFLQYKPPRKLRNAKPDAVFIHHVGELTSIICNKEYYL